MLAMKPPSDTSTRVSPVRRPVLLGLFAGTAVGAGYLLADTLPHAWLIFAEGAAAGAMLTMIAAA